MRLKLRLGTRGQALGAGFKKEGYQGIGISGYRGRALSIRNDKWKMSDGGVGLFRA